MLRKTIQFTLIFFFSTLSLAAGWKGPFSIINISVEGTPDVPVTYLNLLLEDNSVPTAECTESGYVTLASHTKHGEQALSVAMMAVASDKKVWVFFTGTCQNGRQHIGAINILK